MYAKLEYNFSMHEKCNPVVCGYYFYIIDNLHANWRNLRLFICFKEQIVTLEKRVERRLFLGSGSFYQHA